MSILIATPCYAGLVTAQHMSSCLKLSWALDAAGLKHDWDLGWNESLVHRARMEMCAKFLNAGEFSHLFWIDADIGYEPPHVAALWNMDADIAVGVYVMKKPDQCWFAAWKDGALIKDLDQFKEPIEVDYAGTGFMLIRRTALEKIIAHIAAKYETAKRLISCLGELARGEAEAKVAAEMLDAMAPAYQGPNGQVPALFKTPIFNGGLESEDYHFCRIAREAGLKIMMDPNVRLTHYGQYPYGAKIKNGFAAIPDSGILRCL